MAEDQVTSGTSTTPLDSEDTSKSIVKDIVSGPRAVPDHISRPNYAKTGVGERGRTGLSILAGKDLELMREACRTARRVLDLALKAVAPGVTTDQIDEIVHQACIAESGYPSPLNYRGFPKSVCTSVNEVICHGIPDARPLESGDIVNIDVTLYLNGFHGDCSATVPVGKISRQSRHLMDTARECLRIGIAAIKPDGKTGDIGNAIAEYAHRQGCSVVRAYCGHGIGRHFHMEPTVAHFRDYSLSSKIRPGMIFTVEPMINLGVWQHKTWSDGWTAVTADGQRSAQFEHTIRVSDDGVETLTSPIQPEKSI